MVRHDRASDRKGEVGGSFALKVSYGTGDSRRTVGSPSCCLHFAPVLAWIRTHDTVYIYQRRCIAGIEDRYLAVPLLYLLVADQVTRHTTRQSFVGLGLSLCLNTSRIRLRLGTGTPCVGFTLGLLP